MTNKEIGKMIIESYKNGWNDAVSTLKNSADAIDVDKLVATFVENMEKRKESKVQG